MLDGDEAGMQRHPVPCNVPGMMQAHNTMPLCQAAGSNGPVLHPAKAAGPAGAVPE